MSYLYVTTTDLLSLLQGVLRELLFELPAEQETQFITATLDAIGYTSWARAIDADAVSGVAQSIRTDDEILDTLRLDFKAKLR